MSNWLGLFKKYRWSVLAGVLMGTSYMPFPPWALFFCWLPLWVSCWNFQSRREVFFAGWISQFILTLVGFHWISYVSHEFGYMPWPVAILVLLLFASTVHCYIPVALVLAFEMKKRWRLHPLAFFAAAAALHVMGEVYWPSLFTWNLGYPLLAARWPLAQTADVFGFLGLSLMVHLTNALLAMAWLARSQRLWLQVCGGLFIFGLLLHGWGLQKQEYWQQVQGSAPLLKVGLVQANIGNQDKVAAEKGRGARQEIVETHFSLTRELLSRYPDTEVLVWPETAFPELLGSHNSSRFYNQELSGFLKSIQRPLITGAYGNDPPGKVPRSDYNSLFLYGPDGLPLGDFYRKTKLLAFGEYTPLGETFPQLKKWNPAGSGWGWGSGPVTMTLGPFNFAPQICYESLYPGFAAAGVRNGADYIVNLTNDSWFGPRSEPYQHLYMTLARAIENRRPLIRSTNTGISTVVLADGTILEKSPVYKAWSGVYSVPVPTTKELTFFTRTEAYFPLVLFAIVAFCGWFGRRRTA